MELLLNKKQREFLEKILELQSSGKMMAWKLHYSVPYSRIRNILKTGVYYMDKNSFHTPPDEIGQTDHYILNRFRDNYMTHMKI